MFGRYDYTLSIGEGSLKLGVERRDGLYIYRRTQEGKPVQEVVLGPGPDEAEIVIHPVEPITVPKRLSLFLEVAFDPIVLGPSSRKTLFLTFPVEVGVFLESGSVTEVIDTFSLLPSKYSLYGTPKTGVITRWHKSRVYSEPPSPDRKREGVLRLEIENSTKDFATVSRAVFEAHGMVLFFDWEQVAMDAQMTILASKVAETSFSGSIYREGMEKSIELSEAQKIPLVGGRKIVQLSGVEVNAFLMEAGYS